MVSSVPTAKKSWYSAIEDVLVSGGPCPRVSPALGACPTALPASQTPLARVRLLEEGNRATSVLRPVPPDVSPDQGGARAERRERERCWSDRVTRRTNRANLHDTAAVCQERGAIVSPECPQSKGAPARSEASANGVGALATQSHTVTLSGYQDIMSGYQDNTHRHAGLGFGPLEMGPLETHLHVDLRQSRA